MSVTETNNVETQDEVKKLTPEEIAQRKAQMEKFYDEQLPFLEKQCKYEELTSRIEVARFTRNEAMFKSAQLAMHIQSNQPVDKVTEKKS